MACRSFQHTLLLRSTVATAGYPRCASYCSARTAPTWSHRPTGRRSARQGALMLREGPRRLAVACESGDWSHVDVYLTKTTDYLMLLFPGSRWEDQLLRWTTERASTVVAVGADVAGAHAVAALPPGRRGRRTAGQRGPRTRASRRRRLAQPLTA